MKSVRALVLIVLTAISSGGAVAHHAFSMFDQRQLVNNLANSNLQIANRIYAQCL